MDMIAEFVVIIAVLLAAAVVALILYRRRCRERVWRVEAAVKEILRTRYGEVPPQLMIHCSDDELWPVLVSFVSPRTDRRHRLQFAFSVMGSSCSLTSEVEETGTALTTGP